MTYKEWDQLRRERYPNALHTKCASVIGIIMVAGWAMTSVGPWVGPGS